MAEYLIQDTTLDAIADAINAKTGGSSAMTPAQMVTAIGTISGGGGSFTFNPARTVSNNSAPDSLQSILDAVQLNIGDVPFFAAWLDGDKPTNFATTLLYIPSGWKCGGSALTTAFATGTRSGNLSTPVGFTGVAYYVNVSTNSLYRCVSLADLFEQEVVS